MQLPEISDTPASKIVRPPDGARKTRVLYAGDMDFAKAQFASVAPQLHLIAAAAVLGRSADAAHASGEPPDVVLIDCAAPGVDARSIVDGIRARGLDVPVVLALDPGVAEDSPTRVTTELRVDDYTVKLPGWLARLTSRLEFAIAHHRRRRSLEALQASSERLRTVVESAPVCLARVARDGTILAMNAAAMKMVSAEAPDDILGKSLLSFVESGEADSVQRFLDNVSAGQPGSLEFETAGVNGAARIVDTRAVPLSPDAEGRTSALLVLRDATERKRLEESMLAHAAGTPPQPPHAANSYAEERDSLRRQLESALEECRRTEVERDGLRSEAEEARARAAMVEHVRAACTAAEQQLRDLQADYHRVAAERDALQGDLTAGRLRHDSASADHEAERKKQRELLQTAEADRGRLAARCEALEAAIASMEAQQAAEREEHVAARARIEAALQARGHDDSLAAEHAALQASLGALRMQFEEMSAALDAAEARHAAEVRDQRAATEAVAAQLREAELTRASLAAERDELRTALEIACVRSEQLQVSLDDLRRGRDAQIAEAENTHRALAHRVEELQARVGAAVAERDATRDGLHTAAAAINTRVDELQAQVAVAVADRNAAREELRTATDAANTRTEQLQAAIDDLRAAREAQASEAEATRQALAQRVEELQTRVHAAIAERDTVRGELRLALDTAAARGEQLQAALDGVRPGRDTQSAEGDAIRRALAQRVEELQTRLDAVIIDRETLERALEEARADQAVRLHDAAAQRESLRQRLAERDAEYTRLSAEHASLKAQIKREKDAASATGAVTQRTLSAEAPAKAESAEALTKTGAAAPVVSADLHDAQVAFREAFQLLSGELQTAVQNTRAHHAALLRSQPVGYDVLEERVRQAEAECRRLVAQRDERNATVRALQSEIDQHIELRREQRKELVRALQESDEAERRAAARVAECDRLQQMLSEAQAALQRLSKWAANQSTRLAASPVAVQRPVSRIEGPTARASRGDDGSSAPPLEASWS